MNRLTRDLELISDRTTSLWEQMRGQQIFITGGTGFFGCWLMESFCHANRSLRLGASATVLTRYPERFAQKCPHLASDPALILLRGDVRNFEFPAGEFPYVIHAATEASASQAAEAPLEMLSTIIDGTSAHSRVRGSARRQDISSDQFGRSLRKAARPSHACAGDLRRRTGSAGTGKCLCRRQEGRRAPLRPISRRSMISAARSHGVGRFAGPIFLLMRTSPSETSSETCWPTGQSKSRAMERRADPICMPPISPSGCGPSCFAAPDLIPINVGSAKDVSILELAQSVAAVLNPKAEIRVAQRALSGVQPVRYVPAVDRARQLLGLEETIPLEESIRRTATWHREQQMSR